MIADPSWPTIATVVRHNIQVHGPFSCGALDLCQHAPTHRAWWHSTEDSTDFQPEGIVLVSHHIPLMAKHLVSSPSELDEIGTQTLANDHREQHSAWSALAPALLGCYTPRGCGYDAMRVGLVLQQLTESLATRWEVPLGI